MESLELCKAFTTPVSLSLTTGVLVLYRMLCSADFCPRNTDNPQAVAKRNRYSVTPLNVTALYAVSLLGLHSQGDVTRERDFFQALSRQSENTLVTLARDGCRGVARALHRLGGWADPHEQ